MGELSVEEMSGGKCSWGTESGTTGAVSKNLRPSEHQQLFRVQLSAILKTIVFC